LARQKSSRKVEAPSEVHSPLPSTTWWKTTHSDPSVPVAVKSPLTGSSIGAGAGLGGR
jgi:hypothetical protein